MQKNKAILVVFAILLVSLVGVGVIYNALQKSPLGAPQVTAQSSNAPTDETSSAPATSPSPAASADSGTSPSTGGETKSPAPLDLTADANGLSRSTVALETPKGVIKFKFYPKDAPQTVARIAELIQAGFYNGLSFHRVVAGFVIQGGDPLGNGTGGSGTKLKAEFNSRKHVEGTVAMARSQDPDSADSQFYISLGTLPHLDNSYTVFGQVIEGMDVAKRIEVGDTMKARLE